MKLAIISPRHFDNYAFLAATLDGLQLAGLLFPASAIVSAAGRTANTLAARYADERQLPLLQFWVDYTAHGRAAPLVQNHLIVASSNALIAFQEHKSRSTHHAIELAKRQGLKQVIVVHPPI